MPPPPFALRAWIVTCLAIAGMGHFALADEPLQPDAPLLGSWALTLPGDRAGWLEIKRTGDNISGSLLWGTGSVQPLDAVAIEDGSLVATRIRRVTRRNDSDSESQRVLTETYAGRVERDVLQFTRTVRDESGKLVRTLHVTGARMPPLPPRPILTEVEFAAPLSLLDPPDLTGWQLLGENTAQGWRFQGSTLVSRPETTDPDHAAIRYGNLRTVREFEDFKLSFEVRVPAGSNSGVYLRGLYEVQILDSHGLPPDSHHMGAIYGRIAPTISAEKPAGEWQHLAITLVDRHVTVILNGTRIIDNQPLIGCTGGALFADPLRPGPIVLQGDHGPVAFRHFVISPRVR